MKVYVITRSYADMDSSHIVAIFSEKIRSETLLELLNRGIEGDSIYKIEEIEVTQ